MIAESKTFSSFAVDETAKIYGAYAALDLVRESEAWVVRVTASAETIAQGIDERTLCAEMANYALGLTIEKAGQITESAGPSAAEVAP